MSLKTKFSLLLATIFVGLLLVNVSTLSWVVYPAFKELETREAKKNVARVLDILKSDIEGLDLFTYDWAAWDDTYLFIEDKNQAYVKDNFQADYSAEQNHDLYYYWNAKGKPVFHKALSEDKHLLAGLNVCKGQVTYKAVADVFGHDYVEPSKTF